MIFYSSVKPLKISHQIKDKRPYYEIELEKEQIRELISYSPITEYLFGFASNGIGFYIFSKPFSEEIEEVRVMPQGGEYYIYFGTKIDLNRSEEENLSELERRILENGEVEITDEFSFGRIPLGAVKFRI